MNTTEVFLIAMTIIFSLPWLVWRLGRTDYVAPLVVVQILAGIVLGPGVLGAAFPEYYRFVFNPAVVQSLNGVAWWAVMLFVCIAGIELDLRQAGRDPEGGSLIEINAASLLLRPFVPTTTLQFTQNGRFLSMTGQIPPQWGSAQHPQALVAQMTAHAPSLAPAAVSSPLASNCHIASSY